MLNPYTFELFLKDDAKGDPFINESHVVAFGWGTAEQLARMKELSIKVNDVLTKLFDDAGLLLVDFKLEFGVFHGEIVLGDEFSPDGCRLWDKDTRKKMDKDRFRRVWATSSKPTKKSQTVWACRCKRKKHASA